MPSQMGKASIRCGFLEAKRRGLIPALSPQAVTAPHPSAPPVFQLQPHLISQYCSNSDVGTEKSVFHHHLSAQSSEIQQALPKIITMFPPKTKKKKERRKSFYFKRKRKKKKLVFKSSFLIL